MRASGSRMALLDVGRVPQAANLAEIRPKPRAAAVDAVAARAVAFAGEDRLAAGGVSRARGRPPGLRAQKLDDRRCLRFGKIVGRHRGVGDASQDDAHELGIGGRAAEPAVPEIDVRHDVPFGAVAFDAVFRVELLAVRRRPGRTDIWRGRGLRPAHRRRDAEDQNSQRDRSSQHDPLLKRVRGKGKG